MEERPYYCLPAEHVADRLNTRIEAGLTTEEARQRQRQQGFNELAERKQAGFLKLLLSQFNNFLVIILIIAAAVSFVLGEQIDAAAILVIVVLNAVVGVIQEFKAEQALLALKKMSAPNAQVMRDGRQQTIPSRELVVGDIVVVEAGNYVPADLRLIESVNLKIEEASLTGESMPVEKEATAVLDREIPLGDRRNSAFMSTIVTYGRGKGMVTATGMKTQIGLIAEMLQSTSDESTPLQKKLQQLAKVLGMICLCVCAVIFALGLIRDTNITTIFDAGFSAYLVAEKKDIVGLFMAAISLAIAAIPEGLAAVVTICLALGMQRMISRHALIRRLPAVETLGCASVICSDKTGTLTQNAMTVVRAWCAGRAYEITGNGYSPEGEILGEKGEAAATNDMPLRLLLQGNLLCNDALLERPEESGTAGPWRIIGDPTEGALVVAGAKAGLWKREVESALPRIMEIPFDSERKRMTTIHKAGKGIGLPEASDGDRGPVIGFTKGAPDFVLSLCDRMLLDGKIVALTPAERDRILAENREMARRALRVLALAYRTFPDAPPTCDFRVIENGLVFIGLTGMIDPARPEAKAAVKVANSAGLKTVMVTGDYKETAEAIAAEIGLITPGGKVLTGTELDAMSDQELAGIIDDVNVCCRVSPHHKTKIVDAFKSRDHVVAMTGDGVNDAPALKKANIGIAMGITGTDVSKETADMVLTDDNYASIVSAIEEGRIIYSNIRKFVYFLLVCNVGEILIIFFAMLFGLPLPLKPVQLLLLNLVTDGAPALALGLEKGEPDIMQRPPRPAKEPVINKDMLIGLIVIPIVDAIAILSVFSLFLSRFQGQVGQAQTVAFATLCASELLRAFTARSERNSIAAVGLTSNKWMVWAFGSSLVIVLCTIYLPFLQTLFGTVALSLVDWAIMLPFIFMAPAAAECVKVFVRRTY